MAPQEIDVVRAWRPRVPGISEVFHARFHRHAYPAHTHDTWTLFLVDQGAVSYRLDRRSHASGRRVVTLLPPGVMHDGRGATSAGFGKRVLYLDGGLLGEHLIGKAVDRPALVDDALGARVSALHRVLRQADDDLEAESRLGFVVERLRARLGADPVPVEAPARRSDLAEQLRALLDGRVVEGVTLTAAGRALGAGPAHLVRSFSATFGLPPHTYLLGRRIELARRRLLDGEPVAQVAVSCGFYDQAHLTRQFKRHVGTTPARFAAGTTRPSAPRTTW